MKRHTSKELINRDVRLPLGCNHSRVNQHEDQGLLVNMQGCLRWPLRPHEICLHNV